jgi:hypothetical protein
LPSTRQLLLGYAASTAPNENPLASAGLDLMCLSCEVILLAALPAESFPKMPVADETKSTTAEITALHAILWASLLIRRRPEFAASTAHSSLQ